MKRRFHRAGAALLLLLAVRQFSARAEPLKATLAGDVIQFEAPDLQFLSSEALRRLHDGATVVYVFHIGISATKTSEPQVVLNYHCVFSYDIFEEKFKVSRLEPGYRSASHLGESAARELCIHSLAVPVNKLNAQAPFWAAIEYRIDESDPPPRNDSGSILDTLVDIFSRRSKTLPPPDVVRGGPFRLDELRKSR